MINTSQFQQMKEKGEKISMVTAYDYPSAKLAQQAGIDMILVGDSLGMVVLGYSSTIKVTVDDMIHHGKAVARGAGDTFIVVDMPFMSYHVSLEESLSNARKIYQETDAHALKIEGASSDTILLIEKLTEAGIPVVAHLGLTPQSVNVLGGYRVQGKDKQTAEQLLTDALAVEASGAAALVLECIPKELAELITRSVRIPTIGIGAGASCDGQVLVYHDIVKYGVDRVPKFVKSYKDNNAEIKVAIESYINDVKSGQFPGEGHSFSMKREFLPDIQGEDKTNGDH
ncbi:3-methyl-2-oxobutanoate hydroxymethyltransferase [Sediminibacillus albus]|uniref:3-methyl-2-oxobutanoate hydroxymethyltransferase n=1 Tax=Sediminibacillus albus TaxID=407036 RepID=A0A1G8VPF9_9BACI|nr:3-methyl-2-oxobutanoate hydroxymethyltransferase [Sediminibacillus albus]SDJ67824.1 3-methyl-2-oxobutanoate hydroxymethyltransferase [Sediminibacillus albus]